MCELHIDTSSAKQEVQKQKRSSRQSSEACDEEIHSQKLVWQSITNHKHKFFNTSRPVTKSIQCTNMAWALTQTHQARLQHWQLFFSSVTAGACSLVFNTVGNIVKQWQITYLQVTAIPRVWTSSFCWVVECTALPCHGQRAAGSWAGIHLGVHF